MEMPFATSVLRVLAKLVGGAVCLEISVRAVKGHETRDELVGWLALTVAWVAVCAYF
jgi:hypothetical protein